MLYVSYHGHISNVCLNIHEFTDLVYSEVHLKLEIPSTLAMTETSNTLQAPHETTKIETKNSKYDQTQF